MATYGVSRPLSIEDQYGLWLNIPRQLARLTMANLEALRIFSGQASIQPIHFEALGHPPEVASIHAWEFNRARADERHIANRPSTSFGPNS